MERLLLSIIILVGSFLVLAATLVFDRQDLSTILPAVMVLMGNVTAYWLLSNQSRQVADQTSQAINQAQTNNPPQPAPTPVPVGQPEIVITQSQIEAAIRTLIHEQGGTSAN